MRLHELVQRALELRASFPDGPGDVAAGAHSQLRMEGERREDLLPDPGFVAVDDEDLHEPRPQHLEQVFILRVLGGRNEDG
jgi:hypothetical protein